jgi:hypothetical protein
MLPRNITSGCDLFFSSTIPASHPELRRECGSLLLGVRELPRFILMSDDEEINEEFSKLEIKINSFTEFVRSLGTHEGRVYIPLDSRSRTHPFFFNKSLM